MPQLSSECPDNDETVNLLEELQHEINTTDDTLAEEEWSDEDERQRMSELPWWKRPTPWWLMGSLPFIVIAMSATLTPRIEIYTILACRLLRPGIYHDESMSLMSTFAPTRSQLCAADPVVQAAVAKIATAMTTTMGVLSCLSVGWWSAFSDRYGRNRVLGIYLLGPLLTDVIFIFVMHHPDLVPGGYWFLLLGPLVEGSLGGFTGAVATVYAYQADVTTEDNRSRIFSLSLGLMFIGEAIGPTLGSLLNRWTGQLITVFYGAIIVHLIYIVFVWIFLPQSLSLSYRFHAREKYAKTKRRDMKRPDCFGVRVFLFVKRLIYFLAPLAVFFPARKTSDLTERRRRDWNLTMIGLAYSTTHLITGSINYTFQYAAAAFGWTSEILGYWLSLVSVARALFLAFILPVVIKLLKPKPIIIEIPQSPSTSAGLLDTPREVPTKKKEIHSPAFDLGLARISVAIGAISYTCMGLAPSALAFTIFGMVNSMGMAFSPAVQSTALALYVQNGNKESGRLFGALSVVQALGSQILGPSLYGFVYMKTVATFPKAIFFVSVIASIFSSVLLACVRLPRMSLTKITSGDFEGGSENPDAEPQVTDGRSRDAILVET